MAKKLDISKLSREQKLLLHDVIQERKRREKESRAVYTPNPGQAQVHKSQAEFRLVTSGNGAGKTALAVNEAIWALQGFNPITQSFTPAPSKVIVLLDSPDKVDDVWIPELMKWMNLRPDQLRKNGRAYINEIVIDNGSSLQFMFHLQNYMLFESIELDWCICDEPPPRPIFIALRRGGRKANRKPRFLIVGTPIAAPWLRKEIFEPWARGELSDTECFRFGTEVNEKNLAEGYIDSFGKFLSEKEKRIRFHGEFFDLEGLALAHLFDRPTHVVKSHSWGESPCVIAIDPHPSKKHVACLLGVNEYNELFYIKELALKVPPREFARELRRWYSGYRVIDIVCDSLGSADSTGGDGFKSFIQVLNEEGVRARATNYEEKSDEDFIARIQEVLGIPETPDNFGRCVPKLRIFEGNFGIISDIENVQWVKHRTVDEYKPKLDITNKDYLACLKYALATNLVYGKEKAQIFKQINYPSSYGLGRTKSPETLKFKLMGQRSPRGKRR